MRSLPAHIALHSPEPLDFSCMRALSVVAALYVVAILTGERIGARKDDEQVELEGQTKNFGGVIEAPMTTNTNF